LFNYVQFFSNFRKHQKVIGVTVSFPERQYIVNTLMPSPVYQYVINLVVSLTIRIGPGVFINVEVSEHSSCNN